MIQLNLLPDVKLEYIKAEKQRRLIMSISIIAVIAAVSLTVLLLVISTIQKARLSSLSDSIKSDISKLQEKPQIDEILTVQNQLKSLTGLHTQKPAVTNINAMLNEVTPVNVSISEFNVIYTEQKITITGGADSLSSVNKYIDTLKFTKFGESGVKDKKLAFSKVVMTDFGVNQDSNDPKQTVNYTIDMAYVPEIFDITKKIDWLVPSQVTTRSELNRPTDSLFKPSEDNIEEDN